MWLLLLLFATTMITAETISILPIGDSIVAGDYTPWRFILQQQLRDSGVETKFVGNVCSKCYGEAAESYFCVACQIDAPQMVDREHEGHWSLSLVEALHGNQRIHLPVTQGTLKDWISPLNYDVVLLLLGTNDIFSSEVEEIVNNLNDVVKLLQYQNPACDIYVSEIPYFSDAWMHERNLMFATEKIQQVNNAISISMPTLSTAASTVRTVAQNLEYDPNTDTRDGIHPNQSGSTKMAQTWFDAISPHLISKQQKNEL